MAKDPRTAQRPTMADLARAGRLHLLQADLQKSCIKHVSNQPHSRAGAVPAAFQGTVPQQARRCKAQVQHACMRAKQTRGRQ